MTKAIRTFEVKQLVKLKIKVNKNCIPHTLSIDQSKNLQNEALCLYIKTGQCWLNNSFYSQ
jgi:hypothetical protein